MNTLGALLFALSPSLGFGQAGPAPAPTQADAAGAATIATAESLHLRDGSIHWGAILAHDADALQFLRLDTGGEVRVRWELLDPAQADALQRRYGYVSFASEELRLDADVLELDGGESVIGRILSREGENFLIKTGGNLQVIPKTRVREVQSGVSVLALDVFTREELYAQYLAQADLTNAADHFALAQTCEMILDYVHALEHYEAAHALDSNLQAAEILATIERAKIAAGQQEQLEYLRAIDTLRKKGQYDEAIAQAEAFTTRWPESPLNARSQKIKKQVEDARWSAIVEFVRKRWNLRLQQFARSAAIDTTYAQAVAYAQEQLGQELRRAVLEDAKRLYSKQLELTHIEEAWKQRRKMRFEYATYGIGTWLLGEEAALKGMEGQTEEGETLGAKDEERASLEEKIKRFIANQEAQRKSRNRADQEEDFENFWQGFSTAGRAQWIRAFYAEFGGDCELRARPYHQACRDCAGTGVREQVYIGGGGENGGGVVVQRCPTCMGIGVVRKIYFR